MPEQIRKHVFSGLGISLIAGVILAILAPYGTSQVAFLPRLAYWTVLCLAGGIGAALFLPLARKFGHHPTGMIEAIGQSVTSSILVTAMLIGWNLYHASSVNLFEAATLFFFVWVIGTTTSFFGGFS